MIEQCIQVIHYVYTNDMKLCGMAGLQHGERGEVYIESEDESVEVFDHVTVTVQHYINSVNGYESYQPIISAGNTTEQPEAVTKRVAMLVQDSWSFDVTDSGIRVIDMDADGVEQL